MQRCFVQRPPRCIAFHRTQKSSATLSKVDSSGIARAVSRWKRPRPSAFRCLRRRTPNPSLSRGFLPTRGLARPAGSAAIPKRCCRCECRWRGETSEKALQESRAVDRPDSSCRLPTVSATSRRSRTPLKPAVRPHERASYVMTIAAPEEPGRYRLRVTLVQELVRWLDGLPSRLSAEAPLVVVSPLTASSTA